MEIFPFNAQMRKFSHFMCLCQLHRTTNGKRLYFPPNVTPANLMTELNDETLKRGFEVTKQHSDKRGLDAIQRMQIGYDRSCCAKPTESTRAYNFIYTNLPTCKSDRCEFYFTVFQVDIKRVFVKQKGASEYTISICLFLGSS